MDTASIDSLEMNSFKPIVVYILLSLLLASCGSLGHVQFYYFDKSKAEIEQDLLNVINKDSTYSPPLKWNDYELGSDSMYDIFIFFKKESTELYKVRFTNKDSWNTSASSRLGLVSQSSKTSASIEFTEVLTKCS